MQIGSTGQHYFISRLSCYIPKGTGLVVTSTYQEKGLQIVKSIHNGVKYCGMYLDDIKNYNAALWIIMLLYTRTLQSTYSVHSEHCQWTIDNTLHCSCYYSSLALAYILT